MAETIQIKLTSNARQLLRDVEQFPATMAAGIAKALNLENELTIGDLTQRKLSKRGPTTLGVVSNRLRLSIRRNAAEVSGTTVSSSIGSNVIYAGPHEFGFSGPVQVRAHERRIFRAGSGGQRVTVERVKVLLRNGRIVEQRTSRKRTLASVARVKAHKRKMNLPERSFLRSTIAERSDEYSRAVSAAVVAAWEGNA